MAILIVPSLSYPSIQSALDAVQPYDTIQILSGIYNENLSLVGVDNITMTGQGQNVILDGQGLGPVVAFNLVTNNSTITGLTFGRFGAGVYLQGNNNNIINVNSASHQLWGFLAVGNNNVIKAGQMSRNGLAGIQLQGSNNTFESCTFEDNKMGINCQMSPCSGNLIYNNIFLRNADYGVKLNALGSDQNFIIENSIDESLYGVLVTEGKTAVANNIIKNCKSVGVQLTDNNQIVTTNTLINNGNGILLTTNNSIIARNTVTEGIHNGLSVSGNCNYIVENVISGYSQIGLLVNGDKNKVSKNTTTGNTQDTIINGNGNSLNDKLCYQSLIDWNKLIANAQESGDYTPLYKLFTNARYQFLTSCTECTC